MRQINRISMGMDTYLMDGGVINMGLDIIIKFCNYNYVVYYKDKCLTTDTLKNVYKGIEGWLIEDGKLWIDGIEEYVVFEDKEEMKKYQMDIVYGYMDDVFSIYDDLFTLTERKSNEDEEDEEYWEDYEAWVNILGKNICITMRYDTDAQKLTMTDEWGNEAEFSYNVEDWDFYNLKRDFLNTLETLLSGTMKSVIGEIVVY
jgi:hypothetical protein